MAGAGAAFRAPSGVTGALGTIRRPDGRTHPVATIASTMTSLAGIGFMADPSVIASNKDQNARANLTHQRVRINYAQLAAR
jgi:hypothetical protein